MKTSTLRPSRRPQPSTSTTQDGGKNDWKDGWMDGWTDESLHRKFGNEAKRVLVAGAFREPAGSQAGRQASRCREATSFLRGFVDGVSFVFKYPRAT